MKKKAALPHEGHRERVRERCRAEGLSVFSPRECLELVLFYAIPRGDVNPQAEALLEKFGSLDAVWHANAEELRAVPGIGDATALYLSMLGQLAAPRHTPLPGRSLATAARAEELTKNRLEASDRECVLVFALNGAHEILDSRILAEGTEDRVVLSHRELAGFILNTGASFLITAHNHPCGSCRPSTEDIALLRKAASFSRDMECPMLDALILGEDGVLSFAREGISLT